IRARNVTGAQTCALPISSLGRGLGEQTGNERGVQTGPHGGHEGKDDPGYRVPGYPQDMMDMHGMYTAAQLAKINKPQTRGMRPKIGRASCTARVQNEDRA